VGRGPTAQLRTLLEHDRSETQPGELHRRTEPSEPAADDDRIVLEHPRAIQGSTLAGEDPANLRAIVRVHTEAAIMARFGRGTRTTSENTS